MVATEISIIEDLEQVKGLAEMFAAESGMDLDWDAFLSAWKQLYANGQGVILQDENGHGMLGFLMYPDMFTGKITATEAFWYVDPDHRGIGTKLLEAFEDIAKQNGAEQIHMVHLSNLMPEKLRSLYQKRGYSEIETHYRKAL